MANKQNKGFNEIESLLTRREQEFSDSDDGNNQEKFSLACLVDIEHEPEILNFSNDSSDKLMMEIIEKYTSNNILFLISTNLNS